MGLAATSCGMIYGSLIIVGSNTLRRMPYFYRPWEVVLGAGGGAMLFNGLARYEVWAGDRLNQVLNERFLENKDKLDAKYRSILGEHYDNFFSSADKSGSA